MSAFIQITLIIHIASGFVALTTGFLSMLNRKGGNTHRNTGKIFFIAMTGVFISAITLSVAKLNPFLFMVGFFSYYLACSGYRALYLKKLHLKQQPKWIDWLISLTGILFGASLLLFSIHWFSTRGVWGVVPLAFGAFCLVSSISDVRSFYRPPIRKLYWLINHGSRMGGSFAATLTAFIVVNFTLGAFTWLLWILPGVLTGIWISLLLKPFKASVNQL